MVANRRRSKSTKERAEVTRVEHRGHRRSILKNARARDTASGICSQHRQKVPGRHQHPPGFRFLIDTENNIVHDLAIEQSYCDLDDLYGKGNAYVYKKTLQDAVAEGFKPCEECIGERAVDTSTGKDTVLAVIKLPVRSMDAIEAIVQREMFNRDITEGLSRNRKDQEELRDLLNRSNIGTFLYQAQRVAKRERHPKVWGDPHAVFSLHGDNIPTLSRDDDFLADVFVPLAIWADEAIIDEYVRGLIRGLLEIQTFKRALSKLARRYDYRDLAVYGHSCESIDEWVIHREDARCTTTTTALTPQPQQVVTTQLIVEPLVPKQKCWKSRNYECWWDGPRYVCGWVERWI